jgi:hypothetical protein
MKHIVIGMGEVGKALYEVLSSYEYYLVGWQEKDSRSVPFFGRAKAMHVTIPYSDNFEEVVKHYIGLYEPSLVIIHSSVPLGTCDSNYWIHSPIRGVHPNIASGIRTFVKYFGGIRSEEAADIFSAIGIKTVAIPHARDCEAAKLWDTTQYGFMIVLNKIIRDWCEQNGVDFELAYKEFNRSYNSGYAELGRREVARPFLKYMPGPIGGHCVIPNLPLLGSNEITRFIEDYNAKLDLAISGEAP